MLDQRLIEEEAGVTPETHGGRGWCWPSPIEGEAGVGPAP